MSSWFNKVFPNVINLGWTGDTGWASSIYQTLFMTFWSAIFGGDSRYCLWGSPSFD